MRGGSWKTWVMAGLLLGVSAWAFGNEELIRLAQNPSEWPLYGRDYANTRYSPLDQINTTNVGRLKVAWIQSLGTLRGQESVPIKIGDTLYVTTSWPNNVYAVDARTGRLKWKYVSDTPADAQQYACCDVVNRGAAYGNGKIFFGRLDGVLIALDAQTGKELWRATVVDYKAGYTITSPPIVIKDKVITGYAGAEFGARGAVVAYDMNTGQELWRTFTVGPGPEYDNSWQTDAWKTGGGTAWYVASYDPEANLVYYGTGNPAPWNTAVRLGDNKWSASIIALNPDDGRIVWGFQTTPQDAWDWDAENELVLVDLVIKGRKVPALMQANKNGFFYVLDRKTGKFVQGDKYYPHLNWAKGLDANGRPIEIPEMRPSLTQYVDYVCPVFWGGKNWPPMAYNPKTGLVYMPGNNMCMSIQHREVSYTKGALYIGSKHEHKPGPGAGPAKNLGQFRAFDPVNLKIVWTIDERYPGWGGALTTAGGLVFYGNEEGEFKAVDARTGKILWRFYAGSGIVAAPISYAVGGKQYIAVSVGLGGEYALLPGEAGKNLPNEVNLGGYLIAFTLE
jgi:PQQ-dependent dehydrogenase (methanol/ethanol family)